MEELCTKYIIYRLFDGGAKGKSFSKSAFHIKKTQP